MSERKARGAAAQSGDEAPQGAWSDTAVRVLRERYLKKDEHGTLIETPDEMCWRVARAIASAEAQNSGKSPEQVEAAAARYAALMLSRRFMPNSPTLMNAGKGNNLQLSACFVIPVEDSLPGIFESVKHAAIVHQSGGGCIAGDAHIFTTFCGVESIGTLYERVRATGKAEEVHGDHAVMDVTDLGIQTMALNPAIGVYELAPVTHLWRYDVPLADQVRVQAANGLEVTTSCWHPFMVFDGQNFVERRAEDLQTGDILPTPNASVRDQWPHHEYREVAGMRLDEEIAWLMGYYLGDGSMGWAKVPMSEPRREKLRWRLFDGRTASLEFARDILARRFGVKLIIQQDARGLYSLTTTSAPFIEQFRALLEVHPGPKGELPFPEMVAKSPLSVVGAFLAGLVDSDGHVEAERDRVTITSQSYHLMTKVHTLCSLLGLAPALRSREPSGKGRTMVHEIKLAAEPRITELRDLIGPYLHDELKASRLAAAAHDHSHSTAERLPIPFAAIEDILQRIGIETKTTAIHRQATIINGESFWLAKWKQGYGIGVELLPRLIATLRPIVAPEYLPRLALLERLMQGATVVTTVAKPESSIPFYDFTVADHSTYLAGKHGLTAIHNTGFSFSRLRPAGSIVASTHGVASGPVSFMKIFDQATDSVKQGGCVVPETRVATAQGMVQIGTLGPTEADSQSWHSLPHAVHVANDTGGNRAEEFYYNGLVPVRRLRTSYGYSFTGSMEHRIRVIAPDGSYMWKHLSDVQVGDWVALQKHTYPDDTDYRFPPSDRVPHFNAKAITTPERPTTELGEFIGYFIGDGSINYRNSDKTTGRLILTVADSEPEVGKRVLQLAQDLFGVMPSPQKKLDDASTNYFFTSTELVAWLKHIGVTKSSTLDLRVPEVVFQAGAEFARGFLRGLFTADGFISSEGYPSLSSISHNLVENVQQLLLSLGIPSAISVTTNRETALGKNPLFKLRIITREGMREFAEQIAFMSPAKNARLDEGLEKAWEFNDVIPHQEMFVAALYDGPGRGSGPGRTSRGANRELYRDIQHFLPGVAAPRQLTRSRLQKLAEKHEEVRNSPLAAFLTNNQFYDQIASIEDDEAVTVDISVAETHTYIANGFVSHNSRRGANMGILRVDHPDIEEFITCKMDGGITNFNISVAITDPFMQALERDEEYDLIDPHTQQVTRRVRARMIFDKIVNAAWATGDPGLVFLDRANHSTANPIPAIEQLEATNPCVVGSTRLATNLGLRRMDDLYASQAQIQVATDARVPGQFEAMQVMGGEPLTTTSGVIFHDAMPVFRTDVGVPVRKLITSHGIEITATPNHRFLTTQGYKRMDHLEYGDELLLQSGEGQWSQDRALPAITLGERSRIRTDARQANGTIHMPTEWSEELGEVMGYILGDGWIRYEVGIEQDVLGMAIDAKDEDLAQTMRQRLVDWFGIKGNITERQGHFQLMTSGTPASFFRQLGIKAVKAHEKRVPESIFAAPRDAVVGFLRGLFSADGSVQVSSTNSNSCTIRLATSSKDLALDVQQLLLNFGIVSSVKLRRNEQVRLMPNAQRELAEYTAKAQYELFLDRANRNRYGELIGFFQERKNQRLAEWLRARQKPSQSETFITKVATIEDAGEADVFDTTVDMTHSVIVNGIITAQCGEQYLGPYDACNLGSINLGLFVQDGQVDWAGLEATTRDCTRFLDDVIDVNPYPLAEIREKVRNNRRIGLGVMGWADMLFQLGIRYDSDEAIALGERVMVAIRDWSTDESIRMAGERGAFANWERSIYKDGAPRRNSTCTTVAPTGSISIIADCSSGIEPIFALAFQHRVKQPDGTYRVLDFVNPFFVRALEASDVADKAGVLTWVREHGALHGHPAAAHPALAAYVTAHEVAPDWHIRMQAAFQKGVDNSISKCLAAGTLIATSHGLIPVEDFSDIDEPDTFVQIAEQDITIDGHRVLSHYYAGEKPATRIQLDNGAELVGATESHRVLTPDGWKLMSELHPGDLVIGRSMMSHGAGGERLPQVGMYVTNAKRVVVPERMSPDLALFLGMMAADGHTTIQTGAVGLTSSSEEALAEYTRLAQTLFGMAPRHTIEKRNPNVQYLTLNSRVLCRWVEDLIGKGAYAKVVPPQILNGSAEEKLAFLRGLSLDGYRRDDHGLYIYAGMSERLAYGVAELCRTFGLPQVRQERVTVACNGNTAHKVVLSNEMQELVTCIEPHKNGPAHYATYQVLVDREVVNQAKLPTSHPFYGTFQSIRKRQAIDCDNRTAERLGWKADVPVHRVTAVEDAGILSLYDIEVEDAHEYVVNGVVSHNTINLPNSATHADVEHAYMLAWELGCLGITIFRDGSKGEQVLNVGVKKDEKPGQAEAQAANSAPVVADPLLAETPPAVEMPLAAPVVSAPVVAVPAKTHPSHYTNGVKDRPDMVQGYTRRVRAPEGSVYVTLNEDEDGLLEVFIAVGKAGSDVAALADALGRLISLQLRTESPLSQNERARAVAEQLRAIGGSSSIGFGVDRVRSLPDAVARAITQHLESAAARAASGTDAPVADPPTDASNGNGHGHAGGGFPTFPQMQQFAVIGNLCPQCGCNTLVYEEGCKKCMSCGYSEC